MRVVLLVLVLLLVACAVAVSDEAAFVLPPNYLGVTVCYHGSPVSLLRGGLDSADTVALLAHEAVHRRQMRGHCAQSVKRYARDPRFALDQEFEAYCAGTLTRPEGLQPIIWAFTTNAAVRLFRQRGINPDTTRAVFAHCAV